MKPFLAGAVMAACAAWSASAGATTYDSYAEFLAAVRALPLLSEGYENGPLDHVIASGAVYDAIGYDFSNGRSGRVGDTYAHFGAFGLEALAAGGEPDYFVPGDTVTLRFAAPVSVIGGFFAANPGAGADPLFLEAGGERATGGGAGDAYDTPSHYFLGIISTTGAASATFGALAGTDAGFTLDDILYFSRGGAPAPLPEPASWATMLLGFGLAGMALRRRAAVARA